MNDAVLWAVVLGTVTLLFVFVSGANDGASLLGIGLHYPRSSGLVAFGVMMVMLVAVPLTFGLAVARTFTERLAEFDDSRGAAGFCVGAVVSLIVVGVLAWRGLPTSLTLALIGGIAGAGVGAGLAVSWSTLAVVLAIGAAAPAVGGLLGFGLGLISRRIPTNRRIHHLTSKAHIVAYAAQCAAYAANDGQKMIAVGSVAVAVAVGGVGGTGGTGIGPIEAQVWLLIAIAVVFGLGALSSLRKVGQRLGRGLVLARPLHVVSTETAATAAVFGGAALGAPVSMTQSVAAGVVGVAASEGTRRVRWQQVIGIGVAWLVTLPFAFGLGTLAGLLLRLVIR